MDWDSRVNFPERMTVESHVLEQLVVAEPAESDHVREDLRTWW
jgi:hypothetical protein